MLQNRRYVGHPFDEVGRSTPVTPGRHDVLLEALTLRLKRRRRGRRGRTHLENPAGDAVDQRQRPRPEHFQQGPARRGALHRGAVSGDLEPSQVGRGVGSCRPPDRSNQGEALFVAHERSDGTRDPGKLQHPSPLALVEQVKYRSLEVVPPAQGEHPLGVGGHAESVRIPNQGGHQERSGLVADQGGERRFRQQSVNRCRRSGHRDECSIAEPTSPCRWGGDAAQVVAQRFRRTEGHDGFRSGGRAADEQRLCRGVPSGAAGSRGPGRAAGDRGRAPAVLARHR